MITLDPWQKEIMLTTGNILLCSGRQVGKSTIISHYASKYALENGNKSVMIISFTERQSEELFIKCLAYIQEVRPKDLKAGKERPTKHELRLKNGSIIRSLPTGLAGFGIMGYTIHKLIVDEASIVPDAVFNSLTPSLLTTGGKIVLVSTPQQKAGYFWRAYSNPKMGYKVFHINSEKVILERPISPTWKEEWKEERLKFLENEKARMTRAEYAMQYLGEFRDEFNRIFSDELLKEVCILKRPNEINKDKTYACGVDVARMGNDESTFEILDISDRERIKQVDNIVTTKTHLNETTKKILDLDALYNFSNIYIDDGGIGVGVFDYLLENDQTKRKIIAINNRKRALDNMEKSKKRILKTDLYAHLLTLMEHGKIKLLDDENLIMSLKSVQYEYVQEEKKPTKMVIFGNYTHIVEGLTRVAWSVKDKHLNLWVRF